MFESQGTWNLHLHMDRTLTRSQWMNRKNQKISELEAKCNQIAIPAGSTEGSVKETGSSAGGTGSNILAFLRNKEELQQMKRVLEQNSRMLEALMQKTQKLNPGLLQIIEQSQEAFIRMINESNNRSTFGSDSMS